MAKKFTRRAVRLGTAALIGATAFNAHAHTKPVNTRPPIVRTETPKQVEVEIVFPWEIYQGTPIKRGDKGAKSPEKKTETIKLFLDDAYIKYTNREAKEIIAEIRDILRNPVASRLRLLKLRGMESEFERGLAGLDTGKLLNLGNLAKRKIREAEKLKLELDFAGKPREAAQKLEEAIRIFRQQIDQINNAIKKAVETKPKPAPAKPSGLMVQHAKAHTKGSYRAGTPINAGHDIKRASRTTQHRTGRKDVKK